MRIRAFGPCASMAFVLIATFGCDQKNKTQPTPEPKAAPSASASAGAATAEEAPAGCKASSSKPVALGQSVGTMYGLVSDGTDLYYVTWDVYGSRGTLGKARKDSGGAATLTSMNLEPRGLAVDEQGIFYTSGIRLMRFPKQGETGSVLVPIFSSQRIALDAGHVYGVPADYGPYDRVAAVPKAGGDVDELAGAKRPESKLTPNGFSSIAVDASGIYVADSGGDRVLLFPLKGGKPKILAAHQAKAYELALDATNVVFDLGLSGDLMTVPKAGGKVEKLASGLAKQAPIAVDAKGIYTTLAGENDDAPHKLARVPREGGKPTPIASVESSWSVEAVALDSDCVYWVEREPRTSKLALYALGR